MLVATYQITPEKDGNGTFFITDCCDNMMYSVRGEFAYHKKLCPKCFWNGKSVTLYMRGTQEGNRVQDLRINALKNGMIEKMYGPFEIKDPQWLKEE